MKEKRLQKNSVFSVKTDCILLITALIASILFLISPFAVSAQEADVENTETVFEDEAETVPDMNQDPDFDSDPAGLYPRADGQRRGRCHQTAYSGADARRSFAQIRNSVIAPNEKVPVTYRNFFVFMQASQLIASGLCLYLNTIANTTATASA